MRYLATKHIEKRAEELLHSLAVVKPPIKVDVLAHRLGLLIKEIPLGENVSGVLFIEDGKGTIGVNEAHANVRKRFTIAHEIGHYILHREESELFIDKKYTAIFRDDKSSSGELRLEIQANQFAAALLMPQNLIGKAVKEREIDLGDDLDLEQLAKDFDVSVQAMAYRLSNMDLNISGR